MLDRIFRGGLITMAALVAAAPVAFADDLPMPDGYWGKPSQWADHQKLIGKDAPLLDVSDWQNAEALPKGGLKGQVVVIDFWATWCGPCLRALPHNNAMMDKYAGRGVTVIAVCGSRGQEKMPDIVKQKELRFPVARDAKLKSAKAWKVKWWPTYAVVDRAGKVRGIGLRPDAVEAMVDKLLEEQPYKPAGETAGGGDGGAAGAATVDPKWLEGTAEQRKRLEALHGTATPPALQVADWLKGEPMKLADLKGKVVLLDFWATWCGPCIRSIPHTNELMTKHADDGLVVIGIAHSRGAEKMKETVEAHGIAYPVARDVEFKTVKAYQVNGYPDYYLIDRAGKLRIADCRNGMIDEAIAALLAEPAPQADEPADDEGDADNAGAGEADTDGDATTE